MNDNILTADGVYKSFDGKSVLRGMQLSIARGTIYALLGANGAGKSTFYRIAAGLLKPDEGTLTITGGRGHRHGRGNPIGYVSQELAIYPRLSVRQNLAYFGRLGGQSGRSLDEAITSSARIFCLSDLLDCTAGLLSGGEKRRLHAAMGIVSKPDLLLLDEPTAGVDVETRNHILQGVKDLTRQGMSICYTTHYFHEVEALEPFVGIIDGGEIVCTGLLNNLLSAHGRPVVEMKFRPGFSGGEFSVVQQTADDEAVLVRLDMNDDSTDISRYIDMIDEADRNMLISIEIIRPSLESVFLNITGKRHEEYGK